ncbi:MAG: NAD(P)-binding protein, partial [Deltaproteobacteria bacterium]|nr:NAD(P)-binding protein [Deltaproteobacteria bacterium]
MNHKIESNNQPLDVVVIGAGPGGLTAGALLAKAGLKIALIEEQPVVGGYLAGFSRKGFHFNSSIEWLNECGPEGIAGKVFAHIDDDVPEFPPMKNIFRV